MGILSTLKAKAEAHIDSQAEMIEAMPPGTIWASSAEIEYGGGRESRGLLWHDGDQVWFRSWVSNYAWEVSIEACVATGGDIRVDNGTTRCKVDKIRHLKDAVPFVDGLPACTDIPDGSRERVESFFAA